MKDFYIKTKDEAIAAMGNLVGHPVDDSTAGMHGALADAMRRGTYDEAATAILIAGSWNWAVHELAACEAKSAMNGGAK